MIFILNKCLYIGIVSLNNDDDDDENKICVIHEAAREARLELFSSIVCQIVIYA